jgi:hypothetical protein
MLLQLNPTVPLLTPKGKGTAWFVIDCGMENNLRWVVAQDDTGEIWTWGNQDVRARQNTTEGRLVRPETPKLP